MSLQLDGWTKASIYLDPKMLTMLWKWILLNVLVFEQKEYYIEVVRYTLLTFQFQFPSKPLLPNLCSPLITYIP